MSAISAVLREWVAIGAVNLRNRQQEHKVRILILGGTAWLGGYLAETALAAGHEVTCLARGTSGSIPRGATLVKADRGQPGAYGEVMGQRWDAVIDLSRQPGQVRSAAAALAGACKTFTFISSTNVYADHQAPDQDESAALLPPLQAEVMPSLEQYGQAKVACEQAEREAAGAGRATSSAVQATGRCASPEPPAPAAPCSSPMSPCSPRR